MLAMPAVAVYLTLTACDSRTLRAEISAFFSVVLFLGLLFALVKWQRRRTTQRRNVLVTCALMCLFVGSPSIPYLPGVVSHFAAKSLRAPTSLTRTSSSPEKHASLRSGESFDESFYVFPARVPFWLVEAA